MPDQGLPAPSAPGQARRPLARTALGLALGVLAMALGITGAAWGSARARERAERQAYFDFRVRDARNRIEQRLKAYEQALRDVHGLFVAAPVDRDAFRAYVRAMDLSRNYPGIQGLGFVPFVAGRDRDRHMARMRGEGMAGYRIWPSGDRLPATPVAYLEPSEGRNLRALGYDLSTDPVRRAALDRARDLDDSVLTGRLRLVQETDDHPQAGFIMYLPVFSLGPGEPRPPRATVAERRAALKGWVSAPFRMDDFMAGVLGEQGQDLDIEIYDGPEAAPGTLMYDSDRVGAESWDPRSLQVRQCLDLGHHAWTLACRPLPGLASRLGSGRADLLLAAGILGSLLAAGLALAGAQSRDDALALAEVRKSRFDALMGQSQDCILITDLRGRILEANARTTERFGIPPEEIRHLAIQDLHDPREALAVEGRLAEILARGSARFETVHRRRDGSPMDSEVAAQILDLGGERLILSTLRDITESRRTREERDRILRQQEIILEHANIGISLVVDRKQCWTNAWMERTFQYAKAEMDGRTTRDLFPTPEAYEAFSREAYPALLRGEVHESVLELVRRDGRHLWIHCNGKAVDPSDLSSGTLWILNDVTAGKAAEDALRESEARFRTMFKSHNAMMLLVDPEDGRIVDANPAASAFYGYDRDRIRTLTIQDINRMPVTQVKDEMRNAFRGRKNAFLFQHRLSSGEIRVVEVSSSPTEVQGRQLLFSIIQDITDRARAEEALNRQKQRYKSIMAISQDGIHILDERGRVVEANDTFLRMLGYDREDLPALGLGEVDVHFPPGTLETRIQELIATPRVFETRHRRKDGTILDVEVNAGGLELEGRWYLLASSRDITARKRAEWELDLRQGELETLNRTLEARIRETVAMLRQKDQMLITQNRQAAMGEMMGNIAHQWRQPLNALGMVLANLRDAQAYGDLDPETLHLALDKGERLVQKMSSTIHDFTGFLRPGRARTPFSALEQIRGTVALVEAGFAAQGIRIGVEADEDVLLVGFPNEYSQVLLNLLGNARQAIQDGGSGGGRITLRLSGEDGQGCLRVRDSGGGIPEAVLDRIFEPYFSTREAGTGMGLAMSRQIIERGMGGRITARNLDGGAEFTVLVPAGGARP